MKMLQLIYIFAIIEYSFTVYTDNCTLRYETTLKDKCKDIDNNSCSFKRSNYSELCTMIANDCSVGDGDETICTNIFHKDFPKIKCVYEDETDKCKSYSTACDDFNTRSTTIWNVDFDYRDRDLCDGFNSEYTNKVCLLDNSFICRDYYRSCNLISNSMECIANNLLPGYKTKCDWITPEPGDPDHPNPYCKEVKRTCDSSGLKNVIKGECDILQSSDNDNYKCVYSNDICFAKPLCEKTQPRIGHSEDCTNILPLKAKGNGGYEYDYKYKCKYVESNSQARCIKEERKCEDDDGFDSINLDSSICIQLKNTNDQNKRCVYDGSNCKEEYSKCELYSEKETNKNIRRNTCQGLIMLEEDVKCVYNIEEDKCLTERTYETCEEYEGISQKICESINPSSHSKCILDKDSKCKERAFLCSEVFDSENCLYYAKASTSNKRCAFIPRSSHPEIGKCYEEYLRCEDYIQGDSIHNSCSEIILFDGKKCEWDSDIKRCISKNKTCSDAKSREECNLIAKSGVSNPDKLTCLWLEYYNTESTYNPPCVETYKYCSDYRGTDDSFCDYNIKPYNESEDKIDITSKCKYEDGRCERVPKDCEDAHGNPVLCALISPKINDNNLKYCAYIGNQCQTHFKKCENWIETDGAYCENIIPENYLDKPCEEKTVDGKLKCVNKKMCNVFPTFPTTLLTPNVYSNLCHSINYDCKLTTEGCLTEEILTCNDIKFYKYNDENEDICKNKESSAPYKICTLKEDKSGCEEIINISYLPPSNPPTEENSSEFIIKGISLILLLLCLLI